MSIWSPGTKLADLERQTILEALAWYSGNRTHAAEALGIALRTLTTKLDSYRKIGITIPEPAGPGRQATHSTAAIQRPNGHGSPWSKT